MVPAQARAESSNPPPGQRLLAIGDSLAVFTEPFLVRALADLRVRHEVRVSRTVVDLVPGVQAPDDFFDLVPNIPEVKVPNVNVPNIGGVGGRR